MLRSIIKSIQHMQAVSLRSQGTVRAIDSRENE